ncbi:MAG: ATP-binding protein [Opitutae bacterium]|nr:ATP-binding protein [Opitutae bacterium]
MIGRDKELSFITDGFSRRGLLRSSIVLGSEGMGKTIFLEKAKSNYLAKESKSLLIAPRTNNCTDLPSLLSSMARDISVGNGIGKSEIGKFARFLGTQIIQFESTLRESGDIDDFENKLALTFVTGIEDAIIHSGNELKEVCPLLIIDNLDRLDKNLLNWLCGPFNQQIRKSALFKKCRFLFSANKGSEDLNRFFADFGFDKTIPVKLPSLTTDQCLKLAKSLGFEISNPESYRIKSEGNPLKLLKILKNPTNVTNKDRNVMSNTDPKSTPSFSDFSEKELNYLLFASYPSRINRYNLEFFCTPKDAAFCFNWLKRQKQIANSERDGDLILDEQLKNQMRQFHQQEDPNEAEEMSTKATIIDAFTSIFPDPNQHWIPINLHIFESFTEGLCKKLFDEVEFGEIVLFVENRTDVLVTTNKQFSFNDDVKLVTKRFIEIGGGSPKQGLVEKAKDEWIKYQEESTQKRSKLEQEKLNFEEEAFDAEKQILSLDELKKQLLSDFKNPIRQKPKKEYTFSTSLILIVIGIGTVGASLFFDSLGTIHASCGLVLTIFGFFWPNIEIKKTAVQSTGNSPRLAIETQQRSLAHRINGLSSRISSIHGNLESLTSDLESLDQGMNAPYISE